MDVQGKQVMFRLPDEFLELREEHNGLLKICAAHQPWLTARHEHGCQATEAADLPCID